MADIKETVPFSFDEIYTALEMKFNNAGYDIEEGSNTAQLITAMAYLTSMLNVNTAVNINETLLPLARKRKNVLNDSRVLGYEVAHKQSYKYRLTLSYPVGDETVIYSIPKYSSFSADGKTFYYMGETKTIEVGTQNAVTVTIDVKEGTLYKYTDYPESLTVITTETTDEFGETVPQYYIDVPYTDVEEDGLEVFLTYYDYNSEKRTLEQWTKSSSFLIDKDTILDKEFIRLDDIESGTPRIYFKLSGVGLGIGVGTEVNMNVLTTSGVDGSVEDISDPTVFSNSLSGCDITNILLVLEGSSEESIESIKVNAPMFHNSANRAVTKNDYLAIANRHSAVNKSMIWGGDDEFPKSPGHVWFSFFPSNITQSTRTFTSDIDNTSFELYDSEDLNLWYLQNDDIRSSDSSATGIWDILDDYKIISLEFHNRHPLYLNFTFDIEVLKYIIKTSKADINQDIFDIINNAFSGNDTINIESYETEFFLSSINKRIDKYLSDTSGFNSSVNTEFFLSYNNISSEHVNKKYRDIYIPMAVPYEAYFDGSGELLIDKLPSIDTTKFFEEANGYDLYDGEIYTDWSDISGTNEDEDVIWAPIRNKITQTFNNFTGVNLNLTGIQAFPDDPSADTYTWDKLIVTVNGTQLSSSDFTVTETVVSEEEYLYEYSEIVLNNTVSNATVEVTVQNNIGTYYLLNSYKKYILVQLYINGYSETAEDSLADPKSYLIINEDEDADLVDYINTSADPDAIGIYLTSPNDPNDNMDLYLTTEGYIVLNTTSNASEISGTNVRKITPKFYTLSGLKSSDFGIINESGTLVGIYNRYLTLNYSSSNFRVIKNVIPRLKLVNFN